MMQKITTLVLLLAVISSGYAQQVKEPQQAVKSVSASAIPSVAGSYERVFDFMGAPSVLFLNENNTFELVTGATSIRGTYAFFEDKIIFKDNSGDYADTMAGEGRYEITPHGNGFNLKAIKDKAQQRKNVLTGFSWKKATIIREGEK